MKKMLGAILLSLFIIITPFHVEAGTPAIHYYNDPFCGLWGGSCPQTFMYNRNWSKILARYNPGGYNGCNTGSMSVWIMGHPNNAYGIGFTNEDWQDLEVAKQKTGGYYRWGCCYSSDAYNTICLN